MGFKSHKLLTTIVALVIVSGLLFWGCEKKTHEPTSVVLRFGLENEVTNLDPIKIPNIYALQVAGQIYEGLVGLDEKNQPIPLLAESWTNSKDFTVWKFKIRDGVFLHTDSCFGKNLTREMAAEDVRYSFQRMVSKESASGFALVDVIKGVPEYQAGANQNVSGLRVIPPDTFVVELVKPEPFFLYRITSPLFCVFPKEAVDLGPDVFGHTKAIGTGPFRLVRKTDVEVGLERNPKYWRSISGNLKEIKFTVIKNDQIRLTELRNNNIDMMAIPLSLGSALLEVGQQTNDLPVLKTPFRDHFQIDAFRTFNTHFIGLNCEKMDIHLRRAISLATNREEITRAVTSGTGIATPGTIPAGLLGYQPPYTKDIFNIEEAKAELKKSKYNPKKDKIEFLVHEKDNSEQVGQILQAQLSKIGLNVTLKRLDFNSVIGLILKGDAVAFSMFIEYVFSAPEPMINNLFHSSKIPVPNFWRYNNPQIDKGLDDLRKLGNRAEANALTQKLEKQIIDDAPVVFLYQLNNVVIYKNNVTDVAYNGHNIPLFSEVSMK